MRQTSFTVSVLFFVLFFGVNSNVWGHTDITPQEAKDLIDTNADLIVVDVREGESEYCNETPAPPVPPGHIQGALNYPLSSGVLQERYAELPIDGEILVVCRSGHRSNQAAEFLDSKGYTQIYDMTEGMSAWEWETVGCVDSDEDGVNDDLDNCPGTYNPRQEDSDQNGLGDICDSNTRTCPVEDLYGNYSAEAELVRDFRDRVLSPTPLGQEIINLYYELSPALVKAIKDDEVFRGNLKEMVDEILPLIAPDVE